MLQCPLLGAQHTADSPDRIHFAVFDGSSMIDWFI
jgi:hypothetical protein